MYLLGQHEKVHITQPPMNSGYMHIITLCTCNNQLSETICVLGLKVLIPSPTSDATASCPTVIYNIQESSQERSHSFIHQQQFKLCPTHVGRQLFL